MARTGRFGSLPSTSPDLTSTIVSLFESYQAQRDRNIFNAWQSGGDFEGKPVTDRRLMAHFKSRRDEYDRRDPEWDQWNQQYEQIDYDINESKTLLKFEQGRMNERGVARWYTRNAGRFPRDSEAWREAMRNAAAYRKAAQEKAKAGRTISDYDRFSRSVNAIQANKVEPANRAMSILDHALARMGETRDGFMSLDAEQKSAASTHIQEWIREDPDGRKYARQWRNLTGEEFSYNSMRKVLRRGKEGANQQARVAKKYGYSTDQFTKTAGAFGDVGTALSVFRSDAMYEYTTMLTDFREDMKNATSSYERNTLREKFAKNIRPLEKEVAKAGDEELAGRLRNKRMSLLGKGESDLPFPENSLTGSAREGSYENTVIRDEQGGFNSGVYSTPEEAENAWALYDQENIEGIRSGSMVLVDQKGDGILTAVDKKLLGGEPSNQQYTSWVKTMPDGAATTVYSPWRPVTINITSPTGEVYSFVMQGVVAGSNDGVRVFRMNDGSGTTDYAPWDEDGEVGSLFGDGIQSRSSEDWGQSSLDSNVFGLNVTIRVDTETWSRIKQSQQPVQGVTQAQQEANTLALAQQAAGQAPSGGFLEERPPADTPNLDAQTAREEAASRNENGIMQAADAARWQSRHSLAESAEQRWRKDHGFGPDAPLGERAQEASNYVAQDMANRGLHTNDAGDQWITDAEDSRGIQGPGSVVNLTGPITPEQEVQMPIILSEALRSKDQTGAAVAAASSAKKRDETRQNVSPDLLYQHLIEGNNVDPADVESQYEFSTTIDSIFSTGAPGQDELDYIASKPGSGISTVRAITETIRAFRGQDGRSMVEQRLGVNTTSGVLGRIFEQRLRENGDTTIDDIINEHPELRQDISPEPFDAAGVSRRSALGALARLDIGATSAVLAPSQSPGAGVLPSAAPPVTANTTYTIPPQGNMFDTVLPHARDALRYRPQRYQPAPLMPNTFDIPPQGNMFQTNIQRFQPPAPYKEPARPANENIGRPPSAAMFGNFANYRPPTAPPPVGTLAPKVPVPTANENIGAYYPIPQWRRVPGAG